MPTVNFQTWEMCQLSCGFCLYSFQEKLAGGWSLEAFKKTADKLAEAGVDSLEMTPALGEITLDPDWVEKVKHASAKFKHVLVYTNALNLKEGDLNELLKTDVALILMISVYGDSRESYRKTAGKDLYELFLKKIKMIRSFLPLPKNKRIGVDIRFKKVELPLTVSNVDFKNELWKELLTLDQREPNFFVENRPLNSNWGVDFPGLPGPKEKKPFEGPCDCMNVTLNPNGDALICNVCHPYDKRYERLGNIFEDGPEPILRAFNTTRDKMRKGLIPEICENCTEYECKGDQESYFDGEWKTRAKTFWKSSCKKKEV